MNLEIGKFYKFDQRNFAIWYARKHRNFINMSDGAVYISPEGEVRDNLVHAGFYDANKQYLHTGSFGIPIRFIGEEV
jgi:hypothetical protein